MLPKWFNDWNTERPVNIFGPAIAVGVVGVAVLAAALLVSWGQPFATDSLQTGPRGTGMVITKFETDLQSADPTRADYYTEEPYEVAEDAPLSGDIYENVQVLTEISEDNFNRVMLAITQWVAPEQGCGYCHGPGGPETYASDDVYAKVVARRMLQMTQALNEEWAVHVNASGEAGVNCYTCHRGQNVPTDIWFRIAPVTESTEGWAAVQNRVTVQSQYTSLPSDALESYLLEDNPIGVHDFESHVNERPWQEDVASIQDAERTYSLMNYFSNSLGRNCVFCHNTRALYDGGQVTPQWAIASLGVGLVKSVNNDYLVPLKDVLPETRLGPVYADAPKAACRTCHKGYQKPMQGIDAISDWPELTTTGTPVYD